MPGPLSATMSRTTPPGGSSWVSTIICPLRSIASIALSTRLMTTRRICSASSRTSGTPAPARCSIRTSVKMPLYSASVSATSWPRSAGTVRGAGIRANCENSSTRSLSDSTSPTIVAAHSSTRSFAAGGPPDDRAVEAEEPRRGAVDRRDRARSIHRDDAGRNPLENRLGVAPADLGLDMFSLELDRGTLHLAPARRQLARHRVEGLDERAELVVALRLHALIEAARADLARGRGQHLHWTRDPLGEVQPHPCGAH